MANYTAQYIVSPGLLLSNLDVNGQKIVSSSNGDIDIEPNGTGNVLLGNFTFDADQTVGVGTDNYVLTYDNGTGLISLEAAAGGAVTALNSATENELVTVGATTTELDAEANLTFDGLNQFIVTQNNAIERGLICQQFSNDTNAPIMAFRRARGVVSSPAPLQNGDNIGFCRSHGRDSIGAYVQSCYFGFKVDGTVASGSVPTALIFASGSTNWGTERMRIASSGQISITGAASTTALAITGNATPGDLIDAALSGGTAFKVDSTGSTLSLHATAGLGYGTGAGGTVTQLTSRTTGVTLNNVCGAITLVSAAGSATPATFTVTNSAVAATDVIILNQKSGTDHYNLKVTAKAAGSFDITFHTDGGTTTETPVISFAVLKGVTS